MLNFIKNLFFKTNKTDSQTSSLTSHTEHINPTYIQDKNVLYRADGKSITDEEIPYLIQSGYKSALEYERTSNNPKFHRSEYEEELSYNFFDKYNSKISTLEKMLLDQISKIYSYNDVNDQINQCYLAIEVFNRLRKFCCSKGKGGTIYFEDTWEHCHNSKNPDFSYISSIEDLLNNLIYTRDIIIPQILDIVKNNNGILQKNIYASFKQEDKSLIQKTIRKLSEQDILRRIKKGSTYQLFINNNVHLLND